MTRQSSSRFIEELHPYASLLQELETLKNEPKEPKHLTSAVLQNVNPLHLASATNLVHYLGMRRRNMQPLQR